MIVERAELSALLYVMGSAKELDDDEADCDEIVSVLQDGVRGCGAWLVRE